jgi:hypothetical protein
MTFKKMGRRLGRGDAHQPDLLNMTKQVMDGGGAQLGRRSTFRRLTGRRALRPDQLLGGQGRHPRLPGAGAGSEKVTINTISPGYIAPRW